MAFNLLAKIISGGLLAALLCACGDRYETIGSAALAPDKSKVKDDTVMQDTEGHFPFSRLRKSSSFGLTYSFDITEKNRGKEFYVVVYGRSRNNFVQPNATITIVTHDKENRQLSWQSLFLKPHYTDVNRWCAFRDSLHLASVVEGGVPAGISCVAFLPNSNGEFFDLDTLHVLIKQKI